MKHKRKDLRTTSNSYITTLGRVKPGSLFRHVADDILATKNSDALQIDITGKVNIFSPKDLVEVYR